MASSMSHYSSADRVWLRYCRLRFQRHCCTARQPSRLINSFIAILGDVTCLIFPVTIQGLPVWGLSSCKALPLNRSQLRRRFEFYAPAIANGGKGNHSRLQAWRSQNSNAAAWKRYKSG